VHLTLASRAWIAFCLQGGLSHSAIPASHDVIGETFHHRAQGEKVEGLMQAGEMVPTDLVLDLLIAAMDESGMTRFLIDGYPRTLEQLKEFEEKVSRALLTGGGGLLLFSHVFGLHFAACSVVACFDPFVA